MVVAEIAGGCTRFFLFPSPFPPSSPPPSDTSLSASGSSLSRVVLVSDGRRCMKATRGVRDDTFVLSLLCAIGPPPPSGASQAGREPRLSAPQRGRSVGWFLGLTRSTVVSRPENGSSRRVERPLVRGLSACGPPAVGWGGARGGGDGQGPRDGPGRLRAIETAGPPPPRLDGAGDRLIGTTAKRFPNEA